MKTYWDLSEKDRSALDQPGVESFIDAELMTKGVLRAEAPVFQPEPAAVNVAKKTFYRIKYAEKRWGARDALPIAFASREDAAKFLALAPRLVEFHYYDGIHLESQRAFGDGEIVPEDIADHADVAALGPTFAQAGSVKKANSEAQSNYDTQVRENNEALKEMWEDWRRCLGLGVKHAAVIRTLDEYVKTAGNETMASAFLHKVFTAEQVRKACEWFGREYPDPNPTIAYEATETKGS